MAGITAAAISAGAGILGDVMSSQSTAGTNAQQIAANEEMQRAAMAFDQEQQLQAENYDTQMSNTAMQRRVTDLKAAGINPLLAVSQGGASTPVVSGATAPGGNVGSLTPPGQAFSNLAGIASSAVQAYNQTQLNTAQVTKAQADASASSAQAREANADAYIKEQQGPFAGAQASAALDNLKATNDQIGHAIQELDSRFDLNVENARATAQRIDFQSQVNPILVDIERYNQQALRYGMQTYQNQADYQGSRFGRFMNAIGFGPGGGTGNAAAAAGTAARAAASLAE